MPMPLHFRESVLRGSVMKNLDPSQKDHQALIFGPLAHSELSVLLCRLSDHSILEAEQL